MRIFAISDIHIDFEENRKWLVNLSQSEYKEDAIILAGDISDDIYTIEEAFQELKRRFLHVFYVPGNHDLWTHRNKGIDSMEKLVIIREKAKAYDIRMEAYSFEFLSIIPMLGWYDYTFGAPSKELVNTWTDFAACKWPEQYDENSITSFFTEENEKNLGLKNKFVISFSHFLPRIDLMPDYIPQEKRNIYPVLGSMLLEKQIRKLKPNIHVYGHSHVNLSVDKEGILYINNAFGYPYEQLICRKKLKCIFEG